MANILLVDEKTAVEALRGRTEWKPYGINGVFTATSVEEAVSIFQDNEIDAVLSEIDLPGGSGYSLLEWIRGVAPETEFAFLTVHAEFPYLKRALQLGCGDYLLKPLEDAELDRVLNVFTRRIRRRHRMAAYSPDLLRALGGEHKKRDLVRVVKQYVREHIQEEIYIGDIASQVFLNERYLMRAFKAATGTSILQFITEERIWLAKELLVSSDYTVRQVASAVGYGNYSYFIRIFRQHTGETPTAYRAAHREDTGGETPQEDL